MNPPNPPADPNNTPPAPPAPPEPEPEDDDGLDPAKDDFDKDRAMALIAKLRGEVKTGKANAKELADAKKKLTDIENASLSELEREKKRADDAEAALVAAKAETEAERLSSLRNRIAAKYSIPETLAQRLQGVNEQELEADAKELAKVVKTEGGAPPPAGNRQDPKPTGGPGGSSTEQQKERLRSSGRYGAL